MPWGRKKMEAFETISLLLLIIYSPPCLNQCFEPVVHECANQKPPYSSYTPMARHPCSSELFFFITFMKYDTAHEFLAICYFWSLALSFLLVTKLYFLTTLHGSQQNPCPFSRLPMQTH